MVIDSLDSTLTVTLDNSQISQTSVTYTFILTRIPGVTIQQNSLIIVSFPADYPTLGSVTCYDGSLTLSCTVNTRVVTITNYFSTSGMFVGSIQFTIAGVTNPSSTGDTQGFTAQITKLDETVQATTSETSVRITEGPGIF